MSIENLKKVVGFGLSLGEVAVEMAAQPSFVTKVTCLVSLVHSAPILLGVDYSQIPSEIKGLNPAELDELNSYIDANFSIPGSDKEAKIEAAVSLVIDLVKVVEKAVTLCKPAAVPAPVEPVAATVPIEDPKPVDPVPAPVQS